MIELAETDPKAVEAEVVALVARVKGPAISSPSDFARVAEELKDVKAAEKKWDEIIDPLIKSAHATHKGLTTLRAKVRGPLEVIETGHKIALASWEEEQDRIRREEERRLQAEADARAAEEVLEEAIAAEQAGDKESAAAILEAPVLAPIVQIRPTAPRVSGVSFSDNWSAVVTDEMALIRAVAEGRAPMACLTPNTVFLNGQARALKAEFRIPGVRAQSTRGVSASAR
jgi:hypothetical protein